MDECITRKAALSAVCNACEVVPEAERELCQYKFTECKEFRNLLAVPAADVRPVVRYKWQTLDTEFAGRAFVCPCNFIGIEKTNFCPDCGADMREVE